MWIHPFCRVVRLLMNSWGIISQEKFRRTWLRAVVPINSMNATSFRNCSTSNIVICIFEVLQLMDGALPRNLIYIDCFLFFSISSWDSDLQMRHEDIFHKDCLRTFSTSFFSYLHAMIDIFKNAQEFWLKWGVCSVYDLRISLDDMNRGWGGRPRNRKTTLSSWGFGGIPSMNLLWRRNLIIHGRLIRLFLNRGGRESFMTQAQ